MAAQLRILLARRSSTMVVSLYDVKQKELVWRGISENTLANNGNKNQKMVEKAVEKMFKQ